MSLMDLFHSPLSRLRAVFLCLKFMRIDTKQISADHNKLRKLCLWLEKETGLEFTETSNRRDGDPGVHGTSPTRGKDLRMRSKPIGEAICKEINKHWKYDPARPKMKCAVLHGVDSSLHIHLQVHPKTQFYKEGKR